MKPIYTGNCWKIIHQWTRSIDYFHPTIQPRSSQFLEPRNKEISTLWSCSYFQQNSALLDNTLCQHWDNTTPEEPPLTFMPHCHCLKAPAEQAGLKLRADSECPHVSFKVFTGCMERRRGKKSKLSIITWKCKISDIFLLLCNIWCDVQMS